MSTPVPPLDWPHYGIGFLPAVKRGFQKYATFSGRASRGEFWWWALGTGIVTTVLYLLTLILGIATATRTGEFGVAGIPFMVLLIIWGLGIIVPSIAITVRRLHDGGYSGWFYLFNVFGLGIVTLVLCVLETSPNGAKYGPPYPQTYGQGYQPQAYYGQQPGYPPVPTQGYQQQPNGQQQDYAYPPQPDGR